MRPPHENPFRVDRVTALPYLGEDVPALADRFLKLGRAAIVGPHGVGKSTLLRALRNELVARGEAIIRLQLPGSATPAECEAALAPLADTARGTKSWHSEKTVVLLDGYEQLGWRHRRRLRAVPRLLVTAHRPTRMPTLLSLKPTAATLDRLLEQLLPTITPPIRAAAHAAFARHRGDIRETLMTLYDAWADAQN